MDGRFVHRAGTFSNLESPTFFRCHPLMLLHHWLSNATDSFHLVAQAAELARRCYSDVKAELTPALGSMTYAEARGYVRARCADVLDFELQQFCGHARRASLVARELRDRAIDELIRLSIGELLHRERPSVVRRAAA